MYNDETIQRIADGTLEGSDSVNQSIAQELIIMKKHARKDLPMEFVVFVLGLALVGLLFLTGVMAYGVYKFLFLLYWGVAA